MNVTMAESNKNALAHFLETATWRLIKSIDTAVVDPRNEFAGDRAQKVLDESYIKMPAKHDFSKIFEREKFDGNFSVKR